VGSTPRLVWYFLLSPPITTVFGWQQLFRNACKFCDYYYHYYKYLLHINSRAPLSLHPLMRLCHHISSSTHIRVYNGTVQLFSPFLFTFFFLGAPIHTQITAGSFEKPKNFIFKIFYFHDFRDQVIWVIFNYV
jgi:hypothetical protein